MVVATDTLWERIAEDVQSAIQTLNLTGTARPGVNVGANVYRQTLPDETNLQLPCVLVTWEGATEEEESSYESDDILYPLNVWLVDRESVRQENPSPRPDWLIWRRQIQRYFRTVGDTPAQAMPHCPEVWDCEVRPGQAVDPKAPQYQFFVSGLTLRFRTTELRQGRG